MFNVEISVHGLPCLQLRNPSKQDAWFLNRAVMTPYMDDVFYQKKQAARPFIQHESDKLLLVEFWSKAAEAGEYVSWLNSVYDATIAEAKELGLL